MERGESRGTIQLSTLKRAAEALNCDLVYALVPRESLAKSVRVQAEKRAAKMMAPIEHTMKLEDQSVPKYLTEESREELIAAWQRKIGLWSE
jgi:predicted DNA-binding mobile mystery protein A